MRICRLCGIIEDYPKIKLQEHHLIPKGLKGTDLDGRKCLCEKCHIEVTLDSNRIIYPFIRNHLPPEKLKKLQSLIKERTLKILKY